MDQKELQAQVDLYWVIVSDTTLDASTRLIAANKLRVAYKASGDATPKPPAWAFGRTNLVAKIEAMCAKWGGAEKSRPGATDKNPKGPPANEKPVGNATAPAAAKPKSKAAKKKAKK